MRLQQDVSHLEPSAWFQHAEDFAHHPGLVQAEVENAAAAS
jgi:hypothetical protein